MSAPARAETAWHVCGCGCRPVACQPGCPCKECQPGPGIDHGAKHKIHIRSRSARMNYLLQQPEDALSPAEQGELDDLLCWYLYR